MKWKHKMKMEILEKIIDTGKRIVTGAAIVGMVGCASPTLLEGEKLTETRINFGNQSISYKMTSLAESYLGQIIGIRNGDIDVSRISRHRGIRIKGDIPSISDRGFQEVYQEADTDRNGIVDTLEAVALYRKTVDEKLGD
jgi:hypothetical protein